MLRDIWEVIRGRLSTALYEAQVQEKNFWRDQHTHTAGLYKQERELRLSADKRAQAAAHHSITTGEMRRKSDAIERVALHRLGWCPFCNKQTKHTEGKCDVCGNGGEALGEDD